MLLVIAFVLLVIAFVLLVIAFVLLVIAHEPAAIHAGLRSYILTEPAVVCNPNSKENLEKRRRFNVPAGRKRAFLVSDTLVGNQWVEIAFQAIWERLLWVVFCLSQFYHLTGWL